MIGCIMYILYFTCYYNYYIIIIIKKNEKKGLWWSIRRIVRFFLFEEWNTRIGKNDMIPNKTYYCDAPANFTLFSSRHIRIATWSLHMSSWRAYFIEIPPSPIIGTLWNSRVVAKGCLNIFSVCIHIILLIHL